MLSGLMSRALVPVGTEIGISTVCFFLKKCHTVLCRVMCGLAWLEAVLYVYLHGLKPCDKKDGMASSRVI